MLICVFLYKINQKYVFAMLIFTLVREIPNHMRVSRWLGILFMEYYLPEFFMLSCGFLAFCFSKMAATMFLTSCST